MPYNIGEIHKGIQAGHAALRYARKFGKDNSELWDFIDNHETWVILNGGTTNDERDFDGISKGTLNIIGDDLNENEIKFSFFHEPDLNNALTALCFIADERVFNRKEYQDFSEFLVVKFNTTDCVQAMTVRNTLFDELMVKYPVEYKEWVRYIGGIKNVFLRNLIKDKKLA